ncbi:MAG TPA: DUF1987 domain-containing protein [Bacteroidales bacterium]|nr:DUF1987 domain-containing protein [Bacteroidales bacterium]
MEKYIVRETAKTPSIIFDPDQGLFEIKGKSIPENSLGFYTPVLEYIDGYSSSPADRTVLNVKFEFFNTSSSNRIHALFKKFEKMYQNNSEVLIRWFCKNDDENMLEAGEDFRTILHVPFEIIEVEEL